MRQARKGTLDTPYWCHRTASRDVCKGLLAGFVVCWAGISTKRGVGCDAVCVLDRGSSGQEEDLRRLPVAWGGALASARAGAR